MIDPDSELRMHRIWGRTGAVPRCGWWCAIATVPEAATGKADFAPEQIPNSRIHARDCRPEANPFHHPGPAFSDPDLWSRWALSNPRFSFRLPPACSCAGGFLDPPRACPESGPPGNRECASWAFASRGCGPRYRKASDNRLAFAGPWKPGLRSKETVNAAFSLSRPGRRRLLPQSHHGSNGYPEWCAFAIPHWIESDWKWLAALDDGNITLCFDMKNQSRIA